MTRAALLAAWLLAPAPLWADGVIWNALQARELLPQKAQQAWLEWEDGRERLLIAVEPKAVAPRTAWVIPVPAPAGSVRLELVDRLPRWEGAELRARALMNLRLVPILLCFLALGLTYLGGRWADLLKILGVFGVLSAVAIPKFGPGSSPTTLELTTHARRSLDGLSSELVETRSLGALEKHLAAKGCALPAGAADILAAHIREGASFVVSWAEGARLRRSLAVDIRFPASRPFYPMRLTSAYGERRVAADIRLRGWHALAPPLAAGKSLRVGYYVEAKDGGKFTRVVYRGRAGGLTRDWSFVPRTYAPSLRLAAAMGSHPWVMNLLFFALAAWAAGWLAGLGAFGDWRNRRGLLLSGLWGLSLFVPFFGPRRALARLRPGSQGRGRAEVLGFRALHLLCLCSVCLYFAVFSRVWSIGRAPVIITTGGGLVRLSHEGTTKGNLASIRSALSIYYGDMEGAYPAELAPLTRGGKYLERIPAAKVPPHHADSTDVLILSESEYKNEGITDEGGWVYVPASSSHARKVFVNCLHTDTKGSVWSSY